MAAAIREQFAGIVSDFKKDSTKENAGVWMTYGKHQFLVARSHRDNAKFFALMERELRPFQWAIDRGNFAAIKDAADEVMQKVYSETILLGIRKLDGGESLEYTPWMVWRCSRNCRTCGTRFSSSPTTAATTRPTRWSKTQKTSRGPAARIEARADRAAALPAGHQAAPADSSGARQCATGVAVAYCVPARLLGFDWRPRSAGDAHPVDGAPALGRSLWAGLRGYRVAAPAREGARPCVPRVPAR
jgi:hypothetical protein